MSTTASLDATTITIAPGSEVEVPVQIRNNGEIVEGYRLDVVGPAAPWANVEPAELSLYPGTSTTATVTFRPPRAARTAAGQQDFGVVVTPTQSPEEAVVPEGVVEVLPFLDTTAELSPRTSQGRRGKHQVAIDNRGNTAVNVLVGAASDGNRLRFKTNPVGLEVPPGEARFAKLRVKARKRIWRGQPVTHPFVVDVRPQDSAPVTLDGGFVQTPVIPKWVMWLLLALVAAIAALAAAWFWLLKPTIESQAKEAAEEAAAVAEEAAAKSEENAEAANQAATDAETSKEEVEKQTGRPQPPRVRVTDESSRLVVQTAGTDSSDPFTVPEDGTFRLYDVVISNPQGDFGRLRLLVDGEVLYEGALENFRDLDFHYVSPIIASEDIQLEVACRTPGEPPDAPTPTACDVAVFVGGELSVPTPE